MSDAWVVNAYRLPFGCTLRHSVDECTEARRPRTRRLTPRKPLARPPEPAVARREQVLPHTHPGSRSRLS